MRPIELTLTGFRGIRSGLGLKTLTVNFHQYQGLTALVGDNGRGKTTILSNMHPYRLMPDRVKKYAPKAFSFYDECYGPDAQKEFIFEMEGSRFRSVVLIDADKRKQEAYLYKLTQEGEWIVYGSTQDGKLDVYDFSVELLVGSPRMFFTSISRSQKAPALSSYTRREMMDIFSELIHVDENKEKKDTAGDVADALLAKRQSLISDKDALETVIRTADQKTGEKTAAEDRLNTIAGEIAVVEAHIRDAEASLKQCEIKQSLQRELSDRKAKVEGDIKGKEAQASELTASIEERRAASRSKYDERLKAREQAETRLPIVVADLAAAEGRLKASEVSLKECEVKESLQADAAGRRAKISADIAAKQGQQKDAQKSLEDKRAYYNSRHKEKKAQLAAAKDLAARGEDLIRKAGEEPGKAASVATLKEQIKTADEQITALSASLREMAEKETLLKGKENALDQLLLARNHAVQTAEAACKRAEDSARTLEESECVFPEKAPTCKFVKGAVADRDALPALREALRKAQETDPQEQVLREEIAALKAEVASKGEVEKQEKESQTRKEALQKDLETSEKALEVLRAELKDLPKVQEASSSLPVLEKELADILAEGASFVEGLNKQLSLLAAEVETLEAELKGILIDETLPAEIVRLRASIETEKAAVEAGRKEEAGLRVEIASLADLDSILKEGETAVADLEKQVLQLRTDVEALRGELKEVTVDETLPAEIARLRGIVETHKGSLESLRKEDSAVRVTIGSLAEAIKQIGVSRERCQALQEEIRRLDADISEWQLLETAMEGITTLEIDDAGPTVTAITNDLLHTCYGPRFSVNIKTQDEKVGGNGDMKEVFDIVVIDSERGESKSLSVMSGGEETWIDDAVTRSISLYNAFRGGKQYHTLFSDEKDGRLTEAKRKEFMAVKRRVLELGGFACEYFISHTREIQEMADSVIDLNALAVIEDYSLAEQKDPAQGSLV